MTLPNDVGFKEVKDEATRDYVWVFIAIFVCFALCLAIAFCGLGAWAIKDGFANTDETPTSEPAMVDIPAEVNVDPHWRLIFNDEFNDNKNKWDIGPYQADSVTLSRSIEDGKYILDFQSRIGWVYWSFPASNPVKDFVASVEITHVEGNPLEPFGLIFRARTDEYYLFQVDETGRAAFYIYTQDKYTALMERSTSAVKIGEANEITIHAQGSHFTFYINKTKITEIEDDRLFDGYVGVLASPSGMPESNLQPDPNNEQYYPSKFEVDNFKLWSVNQAMPDLETLIPNPGKIVFVSEKSGDPEIYIIHANGTKQEQLTDNTADDVSPRWSLDGGKIVFSSTRDGNSEIYVMNSDGSEVERITNEPSEDVDPAWSADGKSIVFSSNRDGNYEIYIHNLETNETQRITQSPAEDRRPDWSPKDDLILYQSTQYGTTALYTIEISTGEIIRIIPRIPAFKDSPPRFSKDGTCIVYATGLSSEQNGIIIYELAAKKSMDVILKVIGPMETNGSNLFPAWSNDDTQIALVSNRGEQPDIYIISRDGKSIFRVTDTSAGEWDLDWTEN
jgi:Tol biopolymer transport system component